MEQKGRVRLIHEISLCEGCQRNSLILTSCKYGLDISQVREGFNSE